MEHRHEQRMHANLARGALCLAVGALAILAVELIWDAVNAPDRPGRHAADSAEGGRGGYGYEDLMAFALDDDEDAVGFTGVPTRFLDECFDPRDMGEVHGSLDGGVVGISADCEASFLFQECVTRFQDHGWTSVCSGPCRCSLKKERGDIHWAYLDVSQVADTSVAVIVLEVA